MAKLPAIDPEPQTFQWYLGEHETESGTIEDVFAFGAARQVASRLLEAGVLEGPDVIYVRPDSGGRWRCFGIKPSVEVVARV